MLKNTNARYGSLAKSFHWLIALLIFVMLAVGFIMTSLPMSPDKFKIYGIHKSLGITILSLALLRLVWKWMNASPELPVHMRAIEKFLAHAGHAFLYALMIFMPLSGWAMSSASGMKVSVFGLFVLPDLVAPNKDWRGTLRELHYVLAWTIIAVVTLHVLAALLHHFYYKDNVLTRMLPWGKLKENENAPDNARP